MLPNVIYQPDLSLLKSTIIRVLANSINLEQTKKERKPKKQKKRRLDDEAASEIGEFKASTCGRSDWTP